MKSYLDEILELFDEKFLHDRDVIETGIACEYLLGNNEGVCNCQLKDIRKFLRTSLISLLEKYGEEIYMDLYKEKSLKNYNEMGVDGVEEYNTALYDFSTKLKEILSDLK